MTQAKAQPIILGSGSPRRAELLGRLPIAFEISVPGIDEPRSATVDELAQAKFEHLVERHRGRMILTADTLVLLDGAQLGKPIDDHEARAMIHACSGKAITVVSAVCVGAGVAAARHVESIVQLRKLSDAEIDRYIATGVASDKAGALALQSEAASFVDRTADFIDESCDDGGCFSNVVGLPMCAVADLLELPRNDTLCAWPPS